MKAQNYFCENYAESRESFRALIKQVRNFCPDAFLETHFVDRNEDLSIDLIMALPEKRKRLVFLSAGLHGIEGYIGSAVLQLFVNDYIKYLNPDDTGLILVHAINPWGMKHRRRVNENNVDLNRNFIFSQDINLHEINPGYDQVYSIFNPSGPFKSARLFKWNLQLIRQIMAGGFNRLRDTFWFGQFRYPNGLFFGGQGPEKSTRIMKKLFKIFEKYERTLVVDMHSGYGPRYQMAIVNSSYEKRPSAELKKIFAYPLVVKTGSDEFYPLQGDMIDYIYCYAADRFSGKHLYATSFEFGTYGDSAMAAVKTMKTLVDENCLYHYGATNDKAASQAALKFSELFYPGEERWRLKAIEDARRAFSGIMRTEGFTRPDSKP